MQSRELREPCSVYEFCVTSPRSSCRAKCLVSLSSRRLSWVLRWLESAATRLMSGRTPSLTPSRANRLRGGPRHALVESRISRDGSIGRNEVYRDSGRQRLSEANRQVKRLHKSKQVRYSKDPSPPTACLKSISQCMATAASHESAPGVNHQSKSPSTSRAQVNLVRSVLLRSLLSGTSFALAQATLQ